MRSTAGARGRTVIPAELRRRYGIAPGTPLEWVDTGHGLLVVPGSADPVAALRGVARGEGLVQELLADRRRARAGGYARP